MERGLNAARPKWTDPGCVLGDGLCDGCHTPGMFHCSHKGPSVHPGGKWRRFPQVAGAAGAGLGVPHGLGGLELGLGDAMT